MNVVDLVAEIENFPPSPNRRMEWGVRDISDIKWCLVHHTAGPEGVSPADVHSSQQWRNFRTETEPVYAPRITYHYLISPQGIIYKTNWARSITWHCPGKNRNGLSVCLIGNRSLFPVPADQWGSLVWALREVVAVYRLGLEKIAFHRTFFPTQCPGNLMDLDKLRRDVVAG